MEVTGSGSISIDSGGFDPRYGEVRFPDWAMQWISERATMIESKATEYGSNSLAEMGRTFARAQGRTVDDQEALEIGCMLYAKGKLERVLDAMLQQRTPSSDTWDDLAVYALMAGFIREKGRWP